jgi:hypothetical protein
VSLVAIAPAQRDGLADDRHRRRADQVRRDLDVRQDDDGHEQAIGQQVAADRVQLHRVTVNRAG